MNDTIRSRKRGNKLVPQPDDLQILRLLARDFLLLTDEQIYQFFPTRPPRALDRRLNKMVSSGYIYLRYPGPFAMAAPRPVYYVAPKTAEAIAQVSADQLRLRSQRARDFGETALPHLIFANSVHIKFYTAARDYPDYQLEKWIPQYSSLWSHFTTSRSAVQPDGFAILHKADRTFLYFIEVDRATYFGKHLDKRLSFYADYAFTSPDSPDDFKHPRFRVLFITEGEKRGTELLKRIAKYHPDLFWVTSWADFSSHSLFDFYWRTHTPAHAHALDEPCVLPAQLPDPPLPPDGIAFDPASTPPRSPQIP
jgi:Replication-relaxation